MFYLSIFSGLHQPLRSMSARVLSNAVSAELLFIALFPFMEFWHPADSYTECGDV